MLRSLLTAFRQHYPQGSVVSTLVRIHDGLYIVRVAVMVEDRVLSTGLAAHSVLETAEDNACVRALNHSGLPEIGPVPPPSLMVPPSDHAAATRPSPPSSPPPAPSLAVSSPTAKNGGTSQAEEPLRVAPQASHLDRGWDDQPATPAQIVGASVDASSEWSPPLETVPLESGATAPPPPTAFEPDLLSLEGIPTPSIDLSDIIAQTDVELQRLGWNVNQGREFLEKTYGKRSRHDLTDDELLEFLLFLETQPTPGT